jgi:hypothetical protein
LNVVHEGIATSHGAKLADLERGFAARGAVMKSLTQAKAELSGGAKR